MLPRLAILLSAALLLGGCEVVTDLGKSCVLKRKATQAELDAGKDRAVDVTQRELADGDGQDFISFGAPECEDLICVRDATMRKPRLPDNVPPEKLDEEKRKLEAELDKPALGYCTRPCAEGGTSCQVTNSEAISGLAERMTCRAMLMDDAALARLKVSDPGTYQRTFGNQTSSTFCAGKLTQAPAASQGN